MLKRTIRTYSTKMITFFYFFLLIYTIAALVWWGLLLFKQNREITALKVEILETEQSELSHDEVFQQKLSSIKNGKRLRELQYLGEGGAFLLIILLSAGFVYRAMWRQIRFSQQQQNFMLSVTHELKSPIAVVMLNVETLLKRRLPEEKQIDLLTRTLAETNRLNRLSNNMLLATKFENRQYEAINEPLDFSALVHKLTEETENRKTKHSFQVQIPPEIRVNGDALMLQIACSNLIENAIKYAPDDTEITIQLEKKTKNVILQIKDKGEGIPEKEKGKIFTRFYRIGNENTRSSKGTGLGLFLTKKIIHQHNGQIIVKDNIPKGSIFEITLPFLKK